MSDAAPFIRNGAFQSDTNLPTLRKPPRRSLCLLDLAERSLRVWPYFGPQKDDAAEEIMEVRGRTPAAVLVLGERHSVNSWRDVAEKTFESLIRLDEDKFAEIVEQFPKFLGRDDSKFRSSRQLSNGVYMLTNLSASSIHRFCVQATQAAGLSLDDWKIEFA
jgi:hypothetical protein